MFGEEKEEILKMIKKVIIILIVLVLVGLSSYLVLSNSSFSSKTDELSSRSLEYMKDKKLKNDEVWRNVVIEGDKQSPNLKLSLDGCFTVTSSLPVRRTSSPDDCVLAVWFTRPEGSRLTVAKRVTSASKLDDVPDYKLREVKTDAFSKEYMNVGENKVPIYTDLENGDRSYFQLNNGNVVSFSLSDPTREITDQQFVMMISSLSL